MDLAIENFSLVDFSGRPFELSLTRGETLFPLAIIDCAVLEGFDANSVFEVVDEAAFVGARVVFIVSEAFEETVFPGSLVVLPCAQLSTSLPMQSPL